MFWNYFPSQLVINYMIQEPIIANLNTCRPAMWRVGDRCKEILLFLTHIHNGVEIFFKVEYVLKGSQDSIPSPSPSVKRRIMDRKVCSRCKNKTLLGVVNKLLNIKSLFTIPGKVLPLHLKQTFLHIIWIFTEGEGDGIKTMLPLKMVPFNSKTLLTFCKRHE